MKQLKYNYYRNAQTMRDFSFATVTSTGYDDQAAGLYLNIRRFYPNDLIIICTLDEPSYLRLKKINDNKLFCIMASEVWENILWDNIRGRMNGFERAVATKAALAHWVLVNLSKKVLVLDNDLLFLKPIDDTKDNLNQYAMLITPTRRQISRWKKTQQFGIFNSGFVGFSQEGIYYAYNWKKLCFEHTRELFEDSLYVDQKYIDYFVGLKGVHIISNKGINVVGGHLKSIHKPFCDENGIWRVEDGSEIIVFHNLDGTPKEFPLSVLKQKYDMEGANLINLKKPSNINIGVRKLRISKMFSPGRLFLKIRILFCSLHIGIIHLISDIFRLLSIRDLNIFKRFSSLMDKKSLMKQYFDD